ncbi:MAG: phosphotransferase [Spirochaetes bacterium]|nr:phosphotransferase [Spirochaetota bacterium]
MVFQVDENIRSFLDEHVPGYTKVARLDGDASTRAYYRVSTDHATVVLCVDPGFINARESEYPFTVVYRLLKDTVPVPELYASDGRRGLFLMQDLGDDLLEFVLPLVDADTIGRLYESCLENLFSIQMIRGKGETPFSLFFDIDKLMFEFNFFIEHALGAYFRANLPGNDLKALRAEFHAISGMLYRPELFVLNHRDYHSRNIIVCDEIPYIIDFQDARMGLPQYDAVSLLRDSYVTLETVVFERLKEFYFEGGKEMGILSMGRDEFNYYFDIMAFQRNVKALGTFGYQAAVRNNRRFERYIRPTIAYLGDYADRQAELRNAWRILGAYLHGH